MRPIAHHMLTIAASQAGTRQSRVDPRRLLESLALSSWTLTSGKPSMTRRSHFQHAPAAASVDGGAKANISGDENRKLPWLQARNCRACNHDKVYRPSAASRVHYARLKKTAAWP